MHIRLGLPVVIAAALALASPAGANQVSVLESTDSGILLELATDDFSVDEVVHGGERYFRVNAPLYDLLLEAGMPRLPQKGILAGVPFGVDVRVEIVSVETERVGTFDIEPAPEAGYVERDGMVQATERYVRDAAFYERGAAWPASRVELGFDDTLRHQRVVQVLFHPFSWSPRTRVLEVHSRIVVRLALTGDREVPGMTSAVAAEPQWEGVYSGVVVNYESARRWRARPLPRRESIKADMRADHDAYKITVDESGIYRVDHSALAAAGMDATPSTDDIGVYERSYDRSLVNPFIETPVPIVVEDADGDGLFDGDDYILFYGQSFEQQFSDVGYEDRYTDANVYWFGWGTGVAARMGERAGWHSASGLTPPATFPDTLKFEEDVYLDATPPNESVDFYHWTLFDAPYKDDDFELPFVVPGIEDTGDVSIRARYQGIEATPHDFALSVLNGAGGEEDLGSYHFAGVGYSMSSGISPWYTAPASFFTGGPYDLRTVGIGSRSGANLDWFEVAYSRLYEADAGRVNFTNAGETGLSEFEVNGFGTPDIRLFDVTDPWGPVSLTLGAENVSGGWTLNFQDEPSGFTRYEALDAGAALVPTSIERRPPVNIFSREADYIVVTPDEFQSGIVPLVERRQEQGYVVSQVLLSEIYDEFGGGLPSPDAMREYFRYAFEEWSRQPQYVLLVGDASEDERELTADSTPDFMPSYLFLSSGFPKLRASDVWYVVLGGGMPDMSIGRLPVGSTGELSTEVTKILDYENYAPDDSWRNNVLFVADDAWSYDEDFSDGYTRQPGELEFTAGSLGMADVVAASPAGVDTTFYLLSRLTDPYHGDYTGGPGNIGYLYATQTYVKENATPALTELMNESGSIINFQGHANRLQLTHEQLLYRTDVPSIANTGRPYIFFGFACELARFHGADEGDRGDSMLENMLHLSSTSGAIATFACSGIAYLTPNVRYNEKIFEAFFEDPSPSGEPDELYWPRWSLGGLLTKSTIKYITGGGSLNAGLTFMLFGDPLMHVDMAPPSMQVTVDGEPRVNGDYLEPTGAGENVVIVADIIDEVEIDPATIRLEETDVGEIDPGEYQVEAIGDTLGGQSRWYRVTYETPIREWSYDIRLSATDVNGQTATFVLHVAEGQKIVIRDVANHPNPFGDRTRIIYLLNQSGADVTVRIYTVGGRLVRVFRDAPNSVNYNELEWDGFDGDGDAVANGIYLYTIDAEGSDGSTATTPVGRMVRMR